MSNQTNWVNWIDKIFISMMWWIIPMTIIVWLPFTRPFWWIFLPLFLSREVKKLYQWWIVWDFAYNETKWVVLEMIPPKEVLTPLKAMEDIFSTLWAPFYDEANWRERWFDGRLDECPEWMSLEIVSTEGKLHFYARVPQSQKSNFESIFYSHYPELEINVVQDYTREIPQNIPNKEWRTYGENFLLKRENPYPIKTYESFFEPQGEKISTEEKRIDPLNSMLESMSRLGSGEHFWFQFILMGTSDKYEPKFKKEAEAIIAKISKRPKPPKKRTFIDEIIQIINDVIFGPQKEGEGEKATYKWVRPAQSESGEEREMVLTPGEREMITAIENKIKKAHFRTFIRGVYTAKTENWKDTHKVLTRTYFSHFITGNMNFISFSTASRPKTKYFFRKRIPLMRSRTMFKNYVLRFPPFFPNRRAESSVMSTEELATLFHFPFRISGTVLPTMSRIESKRSGPPPNLPIE